MHRLAAPDILILFIYVAFALGIALTLRPAIKTTRDFLEAGRALPAWLCGLAFMAATLGAPDVIGISALGARYGFATAQFYSLGAIPAMLFLGVFMMPIYYGSGARTIPGYLGLRFDEKTRVLSACLSLATAVFISGLSLYAVARVIQALHLFDGMTLFAHWRSGAFIVPVIVAAGLVLICVIVGGLPGVIHNQAMQFFLIVAGLFPAVFLGLKNTGGWSGFKQSIAKVDPSLLHEWRGMLHAGSNPMRIDAIALIVGLGVVFGSTYLCANFSVVQAAFAARTVDAARKAPLIAAIPRLLFPFLLIVPGLLAIGLPTPHSLTTITVGPDGSITHNIEVVSPEVEQGKGIVPAQIDRATEKPILDAAGKPALDYDAALPKLLLHWLPTGVLGLGLSALLASFISGMSANVAAFNAVFIYDLYQPHFRKDASDNHYLKAARVSTVTATILSLAAALALAGIHEVFAALILIVGLGAAPAFATVLLGMFWKRTTCHAAFCGLLGGTAAALLHHALTLPIGAARGVAGGWLRDIHQYPSEVEQLLWTAIVAFAATTLVTAVLSFATKPSAETDLAGLVRASSNICNTPNEPWWKRPEGLAIAILIAAIAISVFLN
ncbi:MAG TPA: hypothetical protein VKB38_06785 [Terracidiphilus sp.]|nr:hypothetical protein [Terracidiphilus sp.]